MARWIVQRSVIISVVLALMAPTSHAAAETRVALIIGNSAYQKADMRLPNPANDAAAMAKALKAAGFDTILQLNATRTDFYKALNQFSDKIGRDPHAVGLFYYAGHAVQADGINWLIPVDASIVSQADLEPSAFDAARVLKSMSAAQNEMNIVILDACRNNPLPKTRGMDRGLARIDAPSGTFIAFAAAPGQTAQDGAAGTNGVFTGEFINAMKEPGLPLELLFKKVIAGVRADTKGEQTPWSESSIQGDFAFIPKNASGATVASANAAALAATPNAPARHIDNASELEQSFWDRIKDSNDPADFKDYKGQYPNGAHVAEANLLMRKLSRSTATASTTPDPGAGSAAPPAAAATRSVSPQPAAKVEPTAVGHWTMRVGASTWFWDVKANGTYSSWSVGAQPGSHSGTVTVADGHWSLKATTTNWADSGTYQFINPDTFVVTGRLGTGAWLRVK
jgi:Caspase domain